MKKRLISVLLALLLTVVSASVFAMDGGMGGVRSAYVYASNLKPVNVRYGPGSDYVVVGSVPCGAQVHINDYIDQEWVEIDYNGIHGYMMGYYLTHYQPPAPGPVPPQPTYVPAPTARPVPAPTQKPTKKPDPESPTSLKEIFSGFSFVRYTVLVRPSSGSTVNMRWAPTKASGIMQKCGRNDELVVIAQNGTWAQVVDPVTGMTGYMMRYFLADKGVGEDGDS